MDRHEVVSHDAWIAARKALLAHEKEFTRARDALSRERRELPWERVEKPYRFDGATGPVTLAQLFAGKSQLIVYHFMFDPAWETPCKSCSFWADNFERITVHLAQRDTTLVAISRAPLQKLDAFKRRMGWTFTWVSSGGSDFNQDFQVTATPEEAAKGEIHYNYARKEGVFGERPGISVFFRDPAGAVYHTYSTYARGLDMMNAAYHYLDLVPKGRDETGPHKMAWVRFRDSYEG
jgi:predicted dithiol-disulfide oxidoreductase (DUF899 family)